MIVVSIKPYDKPPVSFSVKQPGNDQRVVREAKEYLETFSVWCGHYSKGFDIPMLNTRLLKWGYKPIDKRPHIDTYYTLKGKVLAGKGLAHLARWLELPEKKIDVSPDAWIAVLRDPKKTLPTLIERCESDAGLTEELYKKIRHLVVDINR